MESFTEVISALTPFTALLGVVIGALLNEFIRRSNRREQYSSVIFAKRLAAYEGLVKVIQDGSNIASEVMTNTDLSYDERHELISIAVQNVAKHVEENVLYIDDELGTECVALFMGVEDIQDAEAEERKDLAQNYFERRVEVLRMISEDSGVRKINNIFKALNKPKITGPVIERIRELRRERAKG